MTQTENFIARELIEFWWRAPPVCWQQPKLRSLPRQNDV